MSPHTVWPLTSSSLPPVSLPMQALLNTDVVKRGSSIDRVRHVMRLLFRLVDPTQAAAFLKNNLTRREMMKVQRHLGPAYRLLLGIPTGHYKLDLTISRDRDVAARLANTSADEREAAVGKYGAKFDTSQHQNTHNFRNETIDFVLQPLTPGFFSAMPKTGLLEFDYVSTARPSRRVSPMSPGELEHMILATRMEELLEQAAMETESMPEEVRWRAVEWSQQSREARGDTKKEDDKRGASDAKSADGDSDDEWDLNDMTTSTGDWTSAGERRRKAEAAAAAAAAAAEEEEVPADRRLVVQKWSLPRERPIYLSALSRVPNPNPQPPLSGKPLTSSSLTATKGQIGSDEYAAMIKARHPEVYKPQPLVKWAPLCEVQCEGCLSLGSALLVVGAADSLNVSTWMSSAHVGAGRQGDDQHGAVCCCW